MGKMYKALNYLGNILIVKIPSRRIRKIYWELLGSKIGKNTVLFRNSEILDPHQLDISNNCSIGWNSLLPAFPDCVTRVAVNLEISGFCPCYKY